MDKLKLKIKNTALLAPDEKVDILAAMDSYSKADLTELESIIDEYDAEHNTIVRTFTKHMTDELDAIVAKAKPDQKDRIIKASDQIRQGLAALSGQ